MTARRDFVAGVKTIGPALLGIAPFGLICGVSAVDVGLSPLQAVGLSVLVFAGTSQLAAIDLLGQHATAPVVVLTVAVINVRLVMYSASIAPHLDEYSVRWRSLLTYLMTDHVYALAMAAVEDSDRSVSLRWYALGLGVALWVVWQVTTVAGVVLGATVPDRWGLELVVPLTFVAILVPHLKEGPHLAVAILSGFVAIAGAGLPMNLGLVVAALAGVLSGTVLEEVTAT